MSDSTLTARLQPTRLLCPWDFPGKSTGVVASPFSRGSSWPRDQTQVPCLADGLLTAESPGKLPGTIRLGSPESWWAAVPSKAGVARVWLHSHTDLALGYESQNLWNVQKPWNFRYTVSILLKGKFLFVFKCTVFLTLSRKFGKY